MKKSSNPVCHNRRAHDIHAGKYEYKHSEIYNEYEQSRLKRELSEFLANIPENQPLILDLGCGVGNLAIKLALQGAKMVGGDLSENSLQLLKEKCRNAVGFAVMDAQKLPFADNTFDAVCAYSLLHHVPDYLASVSEMLRVVRKGGLIYLDHENLDSVFSPDADMVEYYKKTRKTIFRKLNELFVTGDLFSTELYSSVFKRLFVNHRHKREGDLHVFADDHVKWEKVEAVALERGCRKLYVKDYLLYRPFGKDSVGLHKKYNQKLADMRTLVLTKCVPETDNF